MRIKHRMVEIIPRRGEIGKPKSKKSGHSEPPVSVQDVSDSHIRSEATLTQDPSSSRIPLDNGKTIFASDSAVNVVISNISSGVPNSEILRCCSIYGKVRNLRRLGLWRNNGVSSCVVSMESNSQASLVIKRVRGTRRLGRSWHTKWDAKENVKFDTKKVHKYQFLGKGYKDAIRLSGVDCIKGVTNMEVVYRQDWSWLLVGDRFRTRVDTVRWLDANGFSSSHLIRWGDFAFVAFCTNECDMNNWVSKKELLEENFVVARQVDFRNPPMLWFTWIEVSGIPLEAWSLESFKNIASQWGSLVMVDQDTEALLRGDTAILFIETHLFDPITSSKNLYLDENRYPLRVREIMNHPNVCFSLKKNKGIGSFELTKVGRHEVVMESEQVLDNEVVFSLERRVIADTKETGLVSKGDQKVMHSPAATPVNVGDSKERKVGADDSPILEKINDLCTKIDVAGNVNEVEEIFFKEYTDNALAILHENSKEKEDEVFAWINQLCFGERQKEGFNTGIDDNGSTNGSKIGKISSLDTTSHHQRDLPLEKGEEAGSFLAPKDKVLSQKVRLPSSVSKKAAKRITLKRRWRRNFFERVLIQMPRNSQKVM